MEIHTKLNLRLDLNHQLYILFQYSAQMKQILNRYPNESPIRAAYGYLLQQENQFKQADEQFVQLLEDDDHQIAMTALYQRGRTRVLGKYELEEAILMFESYILKLDDDSPGLASEAGALWRIGMAYELLGQTENARTAYKKAVKLEPDFKEAKKSLKKLK
jgi:tetratricopeptide (TPR) repeat protein